METVSQVLPSICYPLIFGVVLCHLLFRLFDSRPQRLNGVPVGPIVRKARIVRFKPKRGRHTIAVTGGCGLLGSHIVKQLLDKKYKVKVLDRHISRRISSPYVEYIQCDITTDDLSSYFNDVDGICHTAGVVCLMNNPNLLHNVHVVGTQRVLNAARASGVGAFVFTSSSGAVTSPYVQYSQLNTSCSFKPDTETYQFPSYYAKTKYEAEEIVVSANNIDYFRTCAIRIPGMYGTFSDGTPDNILIGPLLSGGMSHVPTSRSVEPPLVDFVYVKNAAYIHVLALSAFLENEDIDLKKVCGKTFNCTNGDDLPKDTLQNWNLFLSMYHNHASDNDLKYKGNLQLKPIPYAIVYTFAFLLELCYSFFCGRVPFPRSFIWNATRCSVAYTITPITLSIQETRRCLQYEPLYTTEESYHDVIRTVFKSYPGVRSQVNGACIPEHGKRNSKKRSSSHRRKARKQKVLVKPHNPAHDIEWTIPALSENIFQRFLDILSGPGMSMYDIVFTSIALVGTMFVAHSSAMKLNDTPMEFSETKYYISMFLALIDGSAAVQCITNASKRWYHVNGLPLQRHLKLTIIAETLVQCVVIGSVYSRTPRAFVPITCSWFLFCLLLVYGVPLHAQRPLAILLTMASYWLLLLSNIVERPAGMEWWCVVLPMKYLISHACRHEPYKQN